MGSSVVVSEDVSAVFIDFTSDLLSDVVRVIRVRQRAIQDMEDALADLFSVDNLVDFSVNGEFTCVMLLTTGSRVERRLIDNDNVSV